jgi:GR25 family glycosyltransferase involved in LPS biosynthesis
MSHVAVMKKYEEEKVLILEDDALFCEDFNEKFAERIETVPADWDVMYLGALLPKTTGKVTPVNKDWARQVFSTGTQAYCVLQQEPNTLLKN